MKKHFILGIMALAALVSCTKSEVLTQETLEEKGISFSAYVGKSVETKTTSITSENISNAGIGILAWRTGNLQVDETNHLLNEEPTFMPNFKLTYDATANAWTYSPKRYWPSTGMNVSFYAYAPYVDLIGNTTNEYHPENITITNGDKLNDSNTDAGGQHMLTLTVPKEANNTGAEYANHTDFMVSRKGNSVEYGFNQNLNKEYAENGDKVKFVMKHALSKISFIAKAGDQYDKYENAVVIIDKLNVNGNFTNKGVYNLFTEKWIIDANDNHNIYSYVNDPDVNDATDPFTVLADELINKNGTEVFVNGVNTGWYHLTKPENDLMVIPYVTETEAAKIISISGSYRIVTLDDQGNVMTGPADTDVIDFEETVNIDLEEGKSYVFRLNIKLTAIDFDVEVEEWQDGGKYDVVYDYIRDSYLVANEADFNAKLPLSYKRSKPYDGATAATLPWLVVEFTPTNTDINIIVEGPNNYRQEFNHTNAAGTEYSLVTFNKDELGTEIVPGEWKITVNGKSTVITVE